MDPVTLDKLRLDLSKRVKNGLAFIVAASLIWLAIAYIWTLPRTSYGKSILTFYAGALMLPLAFGFSKLFKAAWTVTDNPLQPLGLWLNFAQLFYFPILIFALSRFADYFVMVYVIITAAHFFPYSWLYKTPVYAIMAGFITVGAMLLGLRAAPEQLFLIPLFLSVSLLILAGLLYADYRKKLASSPVEYAELPTT